ncbi:hypothetical protein EDB19DRAFT_2039152 [Suillus lakei]|nr:hypothetical protein EDB19DRAFT_2039152 [Suillus lakei]
MFGEFPRCSSSPPSSFPQLVPPLPPSSIDSEPVDSGFYDPEIVLTTGVEKGSYDTKAKQLGWDAGWTKNSDIADGS